jgi:glycosyltransferase involved in cell wall biosynthesis
MTDKKKKAAHFLLSPELVGSPPNEALVHAFLQFGYDIDLYAPGEDFSTQEYGPQVKANRVEYHRQWLLRNALSPRWRKYSVFSGTSEDPMAVVGVLSWIHWRPSITLADEIRSGSYRGNAPESWKKLCRWGMQRSILTIVNDESRIPLQTEYARLDPDHRILVYPGCFHEIPEMWDREEVRKERGIPLDATVLCYSGTFGHLLGAEWMIAALEFYPQMHVWAQIVNLDPLNLFLLKKTRISDRIHLEPKRLPWKASWSSMSAADIGMVIYHHGGPQFQNMGISSNRLCMFLSTGVPVIASRQRSFEFLENYECGILVETQQQFLDAIDTITKKLPEMKQNALKCARAYIDADRRFQELLSGLHKNLNTG